MAHGVNVFRSIKHSSSLLNVLLVLPLLQGCTPLHVVMSQDMQVLGSRAYEDAQDNCVQAWHEELSNERCGEAQVGCCDI